MYCMRESGVQADVQRLLKSVAFTRRRLLRQAVLAGAAGIGFTLGGLWKTLAVSGQPASRLDELARNVISGGPPKDGIPPIDRPRYVSAAEGDTFLRPGDIVFGLDYRGVVKAFPQLILVWHEIVNDEINGEKISITYCPLTGSTVAYTGKSRGDGRPLTFGTSGKLVNSNLLMYDRQTDSTWPQVLGVAITGPNKGAALDGIPMPWTTWERWKRRYPDSLVLSRETGHLRAYGRDPYGSYTGGGPNYYTSGGPYFPVMARSTQFPDKKVVVGIKADASVVALPKVEAAAKGVFNFGAGDQPLVAFYDQTLDAVAVYLRAAPGKELRFTRRGKDEIIDEQTQTTWSAQGKALKGRLAGVQLASVTWFDVMWFAWYAFYPETKVVVP